MCLFVFVYSTTLNSTMLKLYCIVYAHSSLLSSLSIYLYRCVVCPIKSLSEMFTRLDSIFHSLFIFLFFPFSTYRCQFMYGELTDKETIGRLEYTLENQLQDQFEMLLYKSNSKSKSLLLLALFSSFPFFFYYHSLFIVVSVCNLLL